MGLILVFSKIFTNAHKFQPRISNQCKATTTTIYSSVVQNDPKLPSDSGEVPISEGSGWRLDSCCEIFSLLGGKEL
jgi:hypothetical protein